MIGSSSQHFVLHSKIFSQEVPLSPERVLAGCGVVWCGAIEVMRRSKEFIGKF